MCLAIPGKITSLEEPEDDQPRLGKVLMGGIKKDVNLELLPEAGIGDYVLIHVGVAISIVDEEEAEDTLQFLDKMGDLDELTPEDIIKEELEKKKQTGT